MILSSQYDEQLLKWKAEGLSSASICKKLLNELNIEVSASTVTKRITKIKKDRAEAVGANVLVKLTGTVTKDLDILDGIINRALEDELRSRQLAWNEDSKGAPVNYDDPTFKVGMKVLAGTEMWSRLMHVVRTSRNDLLVAIERRLELAGADQGNKPVTKEVKDRLINKLDQLIEQARQVPPPSGPPVLKVVS